MGTVENCAVVLKGNFDFQFYLKILFKFVQILEINLVKGICRIYYIVRLGAIYRSSYNWRKKFPFSPTRICLEPTQTNKKHNFHPKKNSSRQESPTKD